MPDADEPTSVVLVLVCVSSGGDERGGGERVAVSFQLLHRDTLAWYGRQVSGWSVLTAAVCHRVIMSNVRAALAALARLERAQRDMERYARASVAVTGRAPHCRRVLTPLLLHDVTTLFMGYAGDAAWAEAGVACERCGADGWGSSCTPPRLSARDGRLVRDALDHVVSFCWTCLARRDLTHRAPQYVV